jgi:PAS domain S-box-containing protein
VFEHAAAGVAITDLKLRFVECNPAFRRMLGRGEAELMRMRILDLVHPEDREPGAKLLRRLVRGEIASGEFEARCVAKGRGAIWVHQSCSLLRDPAGRPSHIVTLVTDITERRRTEDSLRASEARLRLMASASNVGLWDWNLKTNEVYFSPEWKRQLGYEEDEISADFQEWRSRLHPEDLKPTLRALRKFIKKPQGRFEGEFRFRHKDGSYRWIYTQADVVRDARGKPARMLGCHIDITARKEAEQALGESEAKFSTLFAESPSALALADPEEGRLIDVNRAWLPLTGFARKEEVLGKTSVELGLIVDPSRREKIRNQFSRRGAVRGAEVDIRRRTGETRTLLVTAIGTEIRGRPVLLSAHEDITERKRAEESLAATSLELRRIMDTSATGLVHNSRDLRYLSVNKAYADWLGLPPDKIVGRPIEQVMGRAAFALIRPYIDRVLRGERVEYETTLPIGGEASSIHVVYTPDRDHHGQVVGWVASVTDITARKRAEDALHVSEDRFRSSIGPTGHLPWTTDAQGDVVEDCPIWRKFTGLSYAETKGLGWMKAVHADDVERVRTAWNKAQKKKARYEAEFRLRQSDGTYRWFVSRGVPRLDEAGRIREWVGVATDITERKEAEEALRRSEAQLRAFLENGAVIGWLKDEGGRHVFLSENYERHFGVRLADWKGKTDFEVWPRAIAEEFRRNDRAVLAANKPIEVIESTTGADGRQAWWLNRKFTYTDSSGKRYVGGLGVDITARKLAEDGLHQLNATLEQRVKERAVELTRASEHLRALMDTSLIGAVTIGETGVIQSVNRGMSLMFGYEQNDLIGKNVSMLMPSPDRENHDGYIGRYLRTGEKRIIGIGREVIGRRKDGTEFPIELAITESLVEGRRFFTGMLHDVSNRRRLEAEVTGAYENAQREMAIEMHDGLGQHLQGLRYLAVDLESRLIAQRAPESAELTRFVKLLEEGIEQARSMARGLRPVENVPEGLMNGLRQFAREVSGIQKRKVLFKCPRPVVISDHLTASHLFRIAQEAVNNALKHAACHKVVITLATTPERVILVIADDGVGIRRARAAGMGLRVMQYRANAVRGTLAVESAPDKGTKIICSLRRGLADADPGRAQNDSSSRDSQTK